MVRTAGDEGQRFIDAACQAHAQIEDYVLEQKNSGLNIKVTFMLLAATDRAQVGKSMSELFPLEGKATGKIWDLLEATRIVPPGTDRKQALDFDETKLKGRQVVLKIHLERGQTLNNVTGKYEDDATKPEYPKLGFGAISEVYAEKNAAVPKDPAMLQYWQPLAGMGQGQQTQAAVTPPQNQQQPQQTQPPATSGNPLADATW